MLENQQNIVMVVVMVHNYIHACFSSFTNNINVIIIIRNNFWVDECILGGGLVGKNEACIKLKGDG